MLRKGDKREITGFGVQLAGRRRKLESGWVGLRQLAPMAGPAVLGQMALSAAHSGSQQTEHSNGGLLGRRQKLQTVGAACVMLLPA